jgi:hypothetical protein
MFLAVKGIRQLWTPGIRSRRHGKKCGKGGHSIQTSSPSLWNRWSRRTRRKIIETQRSFFHVLEEALREARETPYEEVFARVVRAEHLIAICLQTGRDKDREHVRILREQADLDMNYLAGVLQRHGLEGKWKPWRP